MVNKNNNEEKSIEFLIEEKKLKETLEIINKEMLVYINKRKLITEYIVDYRKNVLDEYRNDEDKVIDYFDHERYVKEEAFKTIDRRLKELTILKESPYFGRITFEDKEFKDIENLYIGRFGLTPENTYEPAIVDWRAPVAALFYHGSLGDATYKSPQGEVETDIIGRRQLIIKRGNLEGLFDSEIDVKDDILQMVLSNNTSEKLKDVIMTIQREQDEIIRKPREKNVVVNGVAGSGKTTIALHRVAYLLYNYRKELQDKVLILGPNSIFMEYIAHVLPSLGEVGVKQETFTSFALKEIGENLDIMSFHEYLEKLVAKDEELLKDAKYKNSKQFIKDIEEFINKIEDEYFKVEEVKYFGETVVGIDEIKELFNKHYAYMPLFRRSQKIKRILLSKIKDKRDERVWLLNKEIQEAKAKLTSDERVIEENNLEFTRRLRIREIVREVMNSKEAIEAWLNNETIMNIYNNFNHNKQLNINDLAPILYLMIKLDGKKASESYRHVVIDEAQDYSEMQFKVVKELTGSKYFTIVGDVNQRLVKYEKSAAMMDIHNIFTSEDAEYYNLNKSYRSTFEIMDHANNFLNEDKVIPLVRHGAAVEIVNKNTEDEYVEEILRSLEEFNKEGLESIAVVTRDGNALERIWSKLRQQVHIVKFDNEDVIYNGGNVIIPSYFAKGLEFDGVIIADFKENAKKSQNEDLVKYIMSTRALHRLKEVIM
ncbi:HelD family protein [Clostridium cavendishii]|nr:UvrD-helicase domain-containing protein [Clostridium cavendishii]